MRSIRIVGLVRASKQPQIKLLFNIAALESLLLTKNDRDYLGNKLAEKTAFLLGKDFEQRMKIFRDIKKLYSKRSALIHGGKEQDISIRDERQSEMYVKEVIFKLAELYKQYKEIEGKSKSSQSEGLEDLFNSLKFG